MLGMGHQILEQGRVRAWVEGVEFEEQARQQVKNIAGMPFIHRHVAVMPDVHWGMGATIGSVIPTYKAIIPAAVGVDIGCGMMAVLTNIKANDLPDNLKEVRNKIEEAIPHGRTDNGGPNDRGSWGDVPLRILNDWDQHLDGKEINYLKQKYQKLVKPKKEQHLGTLGGGNHFFEVCLDEQDRVWFVVHSGSRGIGNRIGTLFIELAKQDMERMFINLPDKDLAYLAEGSEFFDDYVLGVAWAQKFAQVNRYTMIDSAARALQGMFPDVELAGENFVSCHHNYIEKERHYGRNVWVTRKGAVSAKEGQYGIIPGSMGARSYIVRGKGNKESFHSCSHGAGRRMSRRKARETFTEEQHAIDTQGVECKKDKSVLDETPGAYKDIDAVMEAQKDLVDIVHTLKQVVCVKG